MRTLMYAAGGGMGHVVRAGRFLRQHGLDAEALVLGTADALQDPRVLGSIAVRRVPPALAADVAGLQRWLGDCIEAFAPDRLCIDCFPAGVLGELDATRLPRVEVWHLARRLRWADYAPLASMAPRFDRVFRLESLESEHQTWLQARAGQIEDCAISLPPTEPAWPEGGGPYWLVAHSGPEDEVAELLAYAEQLRSAEGARARLVVATRHPPPLPEDVSWLDAVPLTGYFSTAERIISAAGFNLMQETRPWRAKQHIMPFPRRWDDQFARAREALSTRSR